MAAIEVKLPDIGEGVTEGEIVRWLVKEGDAVTHDQPLVEVMTDKATVEIPSSADGKVTKILAKEGQVVKVGGSLLNLDGAAGAQGAVKESAAPSKNGASANGKAATVQQAPMQAAQQKSAAQSQGQKPQVAPTTAGSQMSQDIYPPAAASDVLATPSTRRFAREAGVNINTIKGSGPVGRVTRDDVAKNSGQGSGAVAAGKPQYQPMYAPTTMVPQQGEERKPFRGIRKKIAENLQRSKQIIPHFTHADEADVTALVAWRTRMKSIAEAKGVKLTYLPFIMKALVATGREFPNFNASIDDAASEVVFKHSYNIGFAADTPEGLLVPVVKSVESKNILDIAHEITTLGEKARTGKLGPDDMKHGTITVTNIGSVGGIYATPIINHPEVAIIGVYEIQKKAVVIDNEIKIRDMMNITATCDHRLIDGAQAARFLKKMIARLENPDSLLLEMV
jgi:pyruvate dehydrogenase E2 component (dihydrolipoamide acetyltransferase)